jgi:hypothetical protein
MTAMESICVVLDALDTANIPYMLTGSLASIHYGIVRSTKDADIVVNLAGKRIQDVVRQLDSSFVLDRQITFETVTGTTRHIVDVPSIPFRIEFFLLSSDPHDQERFQRRRKVNLLPMGRQVWLPTVEDVVIAKLCWAQRAARGKDRDDIRDVLAVQGASALDWEYVYHWCDIHGTRALLDEIRSEIPDDL